MKLLEYQAKAILRRYGIAVPKSELVTGSNVSLPFPIILKSQVPIGGRGKAGGIKQVDNDDELRIEKQKILDLPINGYIPDSVLAEEALVIVKEFYLSVVIDRTSAIMQLVANSNGGIEIEQQTDFKTWPLDTTISDDVIGQELADYFDLPGQTFVLQELIKQLRGCFIENDATLLEINPLVMTADNNLIAGDCKMILDDAASFRHDWSQFAQPTSTNFVTINKQGNVATIANGAGLAMATVDAAFDAGLQPANFLDIGGGANEATLGQAFQQIMTFPDIKAIVINIFAGITRSDEVAKAIVAAKKNLPDLPPLFIRLAGTNQAEAIAILSANNTDLLPDLESCLVAAKGVVDV